MFKESNIHLTVGARLDGAATKVMLGQRLSSFDSARASNPTTYLVHRLSTHIASLPARVALTPAQINHVNTSSRHLPSYPTTPYAGPGFSFSESGRCVVASILSA